jgi:hypothetical protein
MPNEVLLPEKFKANLGLPHGMDYHLVDITLRDGRKFYSLPVAHEAVIVGVKTDGSEIDLNFASGDISQVRRARFGIRLSYLLIALVLAGLLTALSR